MGFGRSPDGGAGGCASASAAWAPSPGSGTSLWARPREGCSGSAFAPHPRAPGGAGSASQQPASSGSGLPGVQAGSRQSFAVSFPPSFA